MTELVIPMKLAEEIRQEADIEGIKVDALLETAFREYRLRAQQRKIDAEAQAWKAMSPDVHARYRGQYVAVHQGQVIDHDPDRSALHGRIRAEFGHIAVLITPADGRPDIMVRSPRLERL
ncbi:MAG: DUF5678 domain-containing protein [Chloroflexota bacterium]